MTKESNIMKRYLFISFLKGGSWQQVVLAMALGVVVGLLFGNKATILEPLGIIFLNLIKMVIVPLVFCTIIYGITNIKESKDVVRIGIKAIFVFLTTAMLAVIIGIASAHIIEPGFGQDLKLLQGMGDKLPEVNQVSLLKMLLDLIPTNAIKALSDGNILQIILFSFFVGFTLNSLRDKCPTVINFFQEAAQLTFKMIASIMKLAPIGVFGYIAAMVGAEGLDVILAMGMLVITITVGCVVQYIVFGLIIRFWSGLSPMPFYRKIIPAQLLAFSTSSSKATLTTLMDISENELGVSKQNSRFLMPLASALNMDGGAIYQGACAVFFAQMFGVDFTITQYVTLIFMCTIASIGGAGIPGGVLLFLGMVLNSVGLPLEGLLLVVSVDRILDMLTTTINVTGDACVTLAIDKSEGTLDVKTYNKE